MMKYQGCRTNHQNRTIAGLLSITVAGMLCLHWEGPDIILHIVCLMTDMLLLGLLLWLLPHIVSTVLRVLLESVMYVTALFDTYCLQHFGKGISPTMLSFLINTDTGEAVDFIHTFGLQTVADWHIVTLLLLMIVHGTISLNIGRFHRLPLPRCRRWILPVCCMLLLAGLGVSWTERQRLFTLLSQQSLTDMEGLVFRHHHHSAYTPPLRLLYAYKALMLTEDEVRKLEEATFTARIDSCSHRSEHIVLIIGESYNRHHSQLYGYPLPTTPHQQSRAEKGELTVFVDVVTPWNITTNAFNQFFSLHHYGAQRPWASYPLFPILFRQAGYRVAFLSNQFRRRRKSKSFSQTGGFFLNSFVLYHGLFDIHNHHKAHDDMDFLTMQLPLVSDSTGSKLDMIHLRGQHFEYEAHYPEEQEYFRIRDYQYRQLTDEQRQVVAHYDNATRWNDAVVDSILRYYKDSEAVVVYMADHGEEVYDDLPVKGRIHAEPTARQVHQEFEIPFWIWCSPLYAERHPDITAQIEAAAHRPWITDRLPHLLLYLAGIAHADYDERLSLIGSSNDPSIPRMIEGIVDYDSLMNCHLQQSHH